MKKGNNMPKKKNTYQIDGQMTLYDFCTDTGNYVAQANTLILGKQNLKLNSAKLIRSAIMQVVREDSDLKPYRVSINDLSKMFGIKSANLYTYIDDITDDIVKNPLYIRRLDSKGNTTGFLKMPWVSMCEYSNGLGLTLQLNEVLKPLLLNLKEHYTQYSLSNILMMKSVYSIRIYELILERIPTKDIPIAGCDVKLSVQEIRECCGLADPDENGKIKYPQFGNFNARVIEPAVAEINKVLTITITSEPVRYGRQIEEIIFHIETLQSKHNS